MLPTHAVCESVERVCVCVCTDDQFKNEYDIRALNKNLPTNSDGKIHIIQFILCKLTFDIGEIGLLFLLLLSLLLVSSSELQIRCQLYCGVFCLVDY